MNTFLLRSFIVLVLGAALGNFMGGCSSALSSQTTLTGFVQAAGTDDNDNPTDVYLFDGKEEYQISKSKTRDELLDLVDHKISASGAVSESFGGKKVITIDTYKVLD